MGLLPYDDRDGWIWMDGAFIPWRDARLHVLSHALSYASCVFEGERMYAGHIFKLREHTERLFASARDLDFDLPFSVAEVEEACTAVCARNGLTDGYVRPLAWRGSDQMGVSARQSRIHVAVAAWAWPNYFDPAVKARGIRLAEAQFCRPDPRTAPTQAKAAGLYMICTVSKHIAERAGYEDALMLDWRGYVAETTGANVFFVRDGVIHTPLPDCFLDGITRRTVIGLARASGLDVIERHIRPQELSTFAECFVTGTAAEVTPVAEIAEHTFTPGPITFDLMEQYARAVRTAPAPALAAV